MVSDEAVGAGSPGEQALPLGDVQAPSVSSPAGQVLYRKWRPQTFAEVVGQEPVTRTLRNSVASGRLAHAYLLCGPRGTGKTSLGRLIAKAANCASPQEGEPCNRCDSCRSYLEGRALDFIEQDAASHNSVDDIRQLRENVVLNPMAGRYKVYLLDEVHMLSTSAENALLKTLEEPPPHIIFVLATTEPHRVSATIVSRCQRFDLRRIPLAAVVERLSFVCEQEGFTLDGPSLQEIARSATGSLRDAINALEQVVTYYGPSPDLEQAQEALGLRVDARSGELARRVLANDPSGSGEGLTEGLKLVASVRDDGVDMRQFSRQVIGYLRNLLLVKSGAAETLDLAAETLSEMRETAGGADSGVIVRALRALGRLDFRDDPQSSLPLELALVELSAEPPPAERTDAAAPRNERAAGAPARAEAVAPAEAPPAEVGSAAEAPGPVVPAEGAAGEGATSGGPTDPSTGLEQSLVEQVRQACKENDKQLAALLNGSCEVQSLEGDVLILGFYHTFHLERMESGTNVKRMEEVVSRLLGRAVTVRCVHAPRSPTPGRIAGGHLVQAAQEMGARPLNRKGGEGDEPRDEP